MGAQSGLNHVLLQLLRKRVSVTFLTTALLVCFLLLNGADSRGLAAASAKSEVDRGRYLVHHVAMCVQCHSPRDSSGDLLRSRLLAGGAIPVEQPFRDRPWSLYAPKISGLPGWQAADVVQLLETGESPDGYSPRAPMPPFRFAREDAEAIVTYLNSLQ